MVQVSTATRSGIAIVSRLQASGVIGVDIGVNIGVNIDVDVMRWRHESAMKTSVFSWFYLVELLLASSVVLPSFTLSTEHFLRQG
jgi:hypothetical protein